jgi:monoterpene epsilon-lactone hydrolase
MPAHLRIADHVPMSDDSVLYEIRVGGHLGPTLLTAFPALTAQYQGTSTLLTGRLPDNAALYGVIAEVEALGLDLLEVRRVDPQCGRGPASA